MALCAALLGEFSWVPPAWMQRIGACRPGGRSAAVFCHCRQPSTVTCRSPRQRAAAWVKAASSRGLRHHRRPSRNPLSANGTVLVHSGRIADQGVHGLPRTSHRSRDRPAQLPSRRGHPPGRIRILALEPARRIPSRRYRHSAATAVVARVRSGQDFRIGLCSAHPVAPAHPDLPCAPTRRTIQCPVLRHCRRRCADAVLVHRRPLCHPRSTGRGLPMDPGARTIHGARGR